MTTAIQSNQAEIYVSFSADINPTTAEVLIQAMANIANRNILKVNLLLSTNGGSVMHGMNIYNVLRAMPFTLDIYNVGNVDSIGNVIFQAGNRRFASPQATFMFHGVGIGSPGNSEPWGELALTEKLNNVRTDQARITDIMATKTTMSSAVIEDLFLRSKTKNTTEALTDGIIDEIKDPQILQGAEIIAFNFAR
jgi:ATP-dependent Clp protease protease subunit